VPSKRVTAADRVRAEIDTLFADPERELGQVLEEVCRLSVRLVMQAALEAEVTEFLGRERYARRPRSVCTGSGQSSAYTTWMSPTGSGSERCLVNDDVGDVLSDG
jgi:putative transposase